MENERKKLKIPILFKSLHCSVADLHFKQQTKCCSRDDERVTSCDESLVLAAAFNKEKTRVRTSDCCEVGSALAEASVEEQCDDSMT